jgi:hypothetical protein
MSKRSSYMPCSETRPKRAALPDRDAAQAGHRPIRALRRLGGALRPSEPGWPSHPRHDQGQLWAERHQSPRRSAADCAYGRALGSTTAVGPIRPACAEDGLTLLIRPATAIPSRSSPEAQETSTDFWLEVGGRAHASQAETRSAYCSSCLNLAAAPLQRPDPEGRGHLCRTAMRSLEHRLLRDWSSPSAGVEHRLMPTVIAAPATFWWAAVRWRRRLDWQSSYSGVPNRKWPCSRA